METIQLKNKLKKCQPYFIERDLLPKLYFKEEECEEILDCYGNKKEIEYWIFTYIFIRGVTENYIAIRLNYSQQNISNRLHKIIERNKTLIEEFLVDY